MSETPPSTNADPDTVFAVLASDRRRLVLEHLFDHPTPVTVPDLVDRLVSAELNGPERPEDLRRRIHVSLHHVHLPKLAAGDMVDYDAERGEVTLTPSATSVKPHLAVMNDVERAGAVDVAD